MLEAVWHIRGCKPVCRLNWLDHFGFVLKESWKHMETLIQLLAKHEIRGFLFISYLLGCQTPKKKKLSTFHERTACKNKSVMGNKSLNKRCDGITFRTSEIHGISKFEPGSYKGVVLFSGKSIPLTPFSTLLSSSKIIRTSPKHPKTTMSFFGSGTWKSKDG